MFLHFNEKCNDVLKSIEILTPTAIFAKTFNEIPLVRLTASFFRSRKTILSCTFLLIMRKYKTLLFFTVTQACVCFLYTFNYDIRFTYIKSSRILFKRMYIAFFNSYA